MQHHHDVAWEMMQNKHQWIDTDVIAYNEQAVKTIKLKETYESFTGEEYNFEVLCERETALCEKRRAADGG